MTQRTRRRQRRRGGIGTKLLFVFGGVVVLLGIAAIAVTSWVLGVAADAPSLSSCRPIDRGGNSTVYAADGSKLGVIDSSEAREPGLDQTDSQEPAAGDGGDRGPALLRTRRRRHRGDPPRRGQGLRSRRSGRGRLDDHPAAGPQPLHPGPEAQPRTQDRRGETGDRVLRTAQPPGNPRLLPQHRLIRDGRRRHRGRGRRGGEDLLLEAGLGAQPGAGGAARRPPPGALGIQPDPQPGPGQRAAQRGAAEDGRTRLRQPRPRRGGGEERARAASLRRLLQASPALLLRLRRGQADRKVRGQHGAPGRPRSPHDDRPRPAAGRPRRDALVAALLDRSGLGAGLDRSPQRRHPGDGLEHPLRPEPVQPRRPGPPPARLDLQGLRPGHGDQAGDRSLHDLLHLETARPQPAPLGPLGSPHRRRGLPGDDQPASRRR